MKRKHLTARIQVELVADVTGDKVEEYWWAVIPPRVYLENPVNTNEEVKITWLLNGRQLREDKALTGLVWDGPVVMNKDGGGNVWNDDWGTPKLTKSSVCTLTLNRNHPPSGGTYKYSIYLKIGSTRVVIDPEVEFEAET